MHVAKSIVFVPYIEPFVLVCFSQVCGNKGDRPPHNPREYILTWWGNPISNAWGGRLAANIALKKKVIESKEQAESTVHWQKLTRKWFQCCP